MNEATAHELIGRALARKITFPEILAALSRDGVESYHVDFLRDEFRYYTRDGESLVVCEPLIHDAVAPEFSAETLDAINRKVQSGEWSFADFVREGPAVAGCAYYIVYLSGKKIRYFGRNGDEHTQHFPGFGQRGVGMNKIARSAIKHADIQAAPEKTFAFLADPMNWPQYAVVNLRSVSPGKDGWFQAVTKFGEGQIKVNGVKEFGILDHTWKDPQTTWDAHCRVVPNDSGSTVMFTLFQPAAMNDEQFDQAMKEMDIEMSKLKEILER